MNVVITGANGALGTALLRYLSDRAPLSVTRLRALVRSLVQATLDYAVAALD